MERIYRLLCAAMAGAQLFFAAGAAQVAFSADVAALPRDHPRRVLAADIVGAMLARLDAATLVVTAAAVLLALRSGRRKAALLPLAAGVCAAVSVVWITPAIHAMRLGGAAGTEQFAMAHAISSTLLLVEMILLAAAAWIG
jgi:hypothetical protein